MDVLARLRQLTLERGWSVYRVAQEAGLSQKTVYNIFYRNAMPSIPTIESLSKAFGMTIAQFFSTEDLVAVTPELKELFNSWITLTPEQKEATLSMMRAFHRDTSTGEAESFFCYFVCLHFLLPNLVQK